MAEQGGREENRAAAAAARLALWLIGLTVAALLLWQLFDVVLLGFAAVLFAIMLRAPATLLERHSPIPSPWSLALSVLLITALVGTFFFILGAQMQTQIADLVQRLPQMVETVGDRLQIADLSGKLEGLAEDFAGQSQIIGRVARYTSATIAILANVLLVLVAGLYLAVRPGYYRHGFQQLVPQRFRREAAGTLDAIGNALRLWLLGQLIAMVVVGFLVSIGLYLIGVPSALALGFLAGIAEFVPLFGPALSAIPALLVALSEGGSQVFWVAGLFIIVQQIEGNFLMPLVQRRTVDLPPVLTLFAILSFAILFGPLGVILGTPLAVVLYVVVKQVYIGRILGEKTDIPGGGSK